MICTEILKLILNFHVPKMVSYGFNCNLAMIDPILIKDILKKFCYCVIENNKYVKANLKLNCKNSIVPQKWYKIYMKRPYSFTYVRMK